METTLFASLSKCCVRSQDLRSLSDNAESYERGDNPALIAFSLADGVAYDSAATEGP